MAALRRGSGLEPDQKVLLVLDQFEQWLHAASATEQVSLINALRQCDGGRLRCLLLVRDDFWMAITRFLDELELERGCELRTVDLFSLEHARKVLAAFGTAFGDLPERETARTDEHREFLTQAVQAVAENEKVICVRLAVFAEMMKGRPWTPASLKRAGGVEGLGQAFLDETFSTHSASPKHRFHKQAACAVLKALLPEAGAVIKGRLQTRAELRTASGYESRPRDFDELMRILDAETRLITPIDREGRSDADDQLPAAQVEGGSEKAASSDSQPQPRYYQLTHDFLVPSLRQWMTREQRATVRGRAELRLFERTEIWHARPENRALPALWEYLNIRLWSHNSTWTEPQQRMMSKAGRYHGSRASLAMILLLVAGLTGMGIRRVALNEQARIREESRKLQMATRAEGLVDALVQADTANVSNIIQELADCRPWANPLLQSRIARYPEDSLPKTHLALALLPFDERQAAYLHTRLLEVDAVPFSTLRDALFSAHQPQSTEGKRRDASLIKFLWDVALDQQQPPPRRFRAACALATFARDDMRWNEPMFGDLVANQLVAVSPSELIGWQRALRPVRKVLISPLEDISRDAVRREQERSFATDTLADYLADEPEHLFELLADAERFQYLTMLRKFRTHGPIAIKLAEAQMLATASPDADAREQQRIARRRANSAFTLVELGQIDRIWPLLKHSADPGARSYFIDWNADLLGDPSVLIQRWKVESDVSIRRALLWCLGELPESRLSHENKSALLNELLSGFHEEKDAGLHSACEWLLRKWGQTAKITDANGSLRINEQQLAERLAKGDLPWYVTTTGHRMIVLDAGAFAMGSPPSEPDRSEHETLHHRALNRRFALAAHEVTRDQFDEFLKDRPEIARIDVSSLVKTGDSPQVSTSWYVAAAYCNWLSQREKLDEKQWCYVTNSTGQFADGMTVKEDFLTLSGYRLPTEAEWEYACRSHATTRHYFGSVSDLLPKYAWFQGNAQVRTWPVGSLKSNDFGFFDMHGNVWEWCHNQYTDKIPMPGEVVPDELEVPPVADAKTRYVRGGSFYEQLSHLRAAQRYNYKPISTQGNIGFRPARTMPPSSGMR